MQTPSWTRWLTCLSTLPTAVPSLHTPFRSGWNHVFTDGSCFHQAWPSLRYAAWSAVLAPPFSCTWSFGVHGILGVGHIPGVVQSAFRAELYAVAFVLHHAALRGAHVVLWTDCLSVIHRFHLLTAGKLVIKPAPPHGDLWAWIATSVASLGLERVRIRKVEAHKDWRKALSKQSAWKRWNNGVADHAAQLANTDRPPSFVQLWSQHQREQLAAHELHRQVAQLMVAIATYCVQCDASAKEPAEESALEARPPRETRVFQMEYAVSGWDGRVSLDFSHRFGSNMARLVAKWWSSRTGGSTQPLQWVAFVSLLIDFQMATNNPGPLKSGKNWLDVCTRPYLDPGAHGFHVRVKWFRACLLWFWKLHGITVVTANARPDSDALQAHIACCSVPWDGWCLAQTETWLLRNLSSPCTRDAKALRVLPTAAAHSGMSMLGPWALE